MNYICIIITISFSCIFENAFCGWCLPLATFGAEVPASACDEKLCKTVTLQQLEQIQNKPVRATKWNIGGAHVVNPKCGIIVEYSVNPYLEETKKYSCTGRRFDYTEFEHKKGERTIFSKSLVNDKNEDTTWKLCFPYVNGSDFIYRMCRTKPVPATGKGHASIIVFEEEGKTGKKEIMAVASSLNVEWANATIKCQ